MNRRRSAPRLVRTLAALALSVSLAPLHGCSPASEGRPAGSIHIETGRMKASDVDAAKTKAKQAKVRRP